MARRVTARQRAAARKNLEKARRRKRNFHAKNRSKIQKSRKYKKLHLKEYKKTGMLMVDSGGKKRTWRKTMKAVRVGGKANKKYAKKKARIDRKVSKYQARSR